MMLPGHTHEDIDAMFRFIADALRAKGLVQTISQFEEAARHAFKEQTVHVEQVAAVHDYAAWLRPNVGKFEGLKTARYFVFTKRSDGVPIMHYKPFVGHEHLYPTLKEGTTNMPVYEMVGDNQKKYATDPNGIEVFGELPSPSGEPEAQPFEAERLDVEKTYEQVKCIIDAKPMLFDAECVAWWKLWREETPTSVEKTLEKHPLTFEWPSKTGEWVDPALRDLGVEVSDYCETITYLNSRGQQGFNIQEADQAREEERRTQPVLSAGDLLVMQPGEDDGMHDLPFWICEVAAHVPSEEDEIPVVWRTAFKGGYAKDDVEGQWLPICIGSNTARGGVTRYHAYTNKCRYNGRDRHGHGRMEQMVQRGQVVLYFAKLNRAKSTM